MTNKVLGFGQIASSFLNGNTRACFTSIHLLHCQASSPVKDAY